MVETNVLREYVNGDFLVTLLKDGTKTRSVRVGCDYDNLEVMYPEVIDIKITSQCDNPICRAFCYESSNMQGEHADFPWLKKFLERIPYGVEAAIGGGNPLFYPELNEFLTFVKSRGAIPNLTLNQYHVNKLIGQVRGLFERGLVNAIGLSYVGLDTDVALQLSRDYPVVVHLILGVHSPEDLLELRDRGFNSFLLLGFKTQQGHGIKYFKEHSQNILDSFEEWKASILSLIQEPNAVTGMDSLALRQLDIESLLPPEIWEMGYQGDEGRFSMYIDAVKRTYSESSASPCRYEIGEQDLLETFKELQTKIY